MRLHWFSGRLQEPEGLRLELETPENSILSLVESQATFRSVNVPPAMEFLRGESPKYRHARPRYLRFLHVQPLRCRCEQLSLLPLRQQIREIIKRGAAQVRSGQGIESIGKRFYGIWFHRL